MYLCRVSFDWWAALGSTHEGKVDPGFWLLQGHLQPEWVREKGRKGEKGEGGDGKRRGRGGERGEGEGCNGRLA